MPLDIVRKVKELDLPEGDFIVIGSGTLTALGLTDNSQDIDLAVSETVYGILRDRGWQRHRGHGGKSVLRYDKYDVGIGFGDWSLEELLADSIVIDGVHFISLEKLLAWKKSEAREKDKPYISLIETYLSHQSGTSG